MENEKARTRNIEEAVRFYRCPTDAATIADTTTDLSWDRRMFLADIVKDEFFFDDLCKNPQLLARLNNHLREDLDMDPLPDSHLDGDGFMLPGILDQKLSRRGVKKANLQYGENKGRYLKEGRLSSQNKWSRSNHNNSIQ